jgi:hypothetical protein
MHPVIAPATPAVFNMTYPAPIIMQSVQPPPQMQAVPQNAPTGTMKVGDMCLAKYWEDGKVNNKNLTHKYIFN